MKKNNEIKLRPTFWRTCRAVMNVTRLRLLKAVIESQMRNEYDPKDGRRKVDVLFVPVWR